MRYIRLRKVYIDIFIPLILLTSYLLGFTGQLFMAYLAVMLHEAAHAVSAIFLGCQVKHIYFLSFGTRVDLNIDLDSKLQKCLIYIAGPFTNLCLALIFYNLSLDFELRNTIVITNLCLAIFNLLPLSPLDGGEILSVYTASRYGFFYSRKISRITYLTIISILILFSVPVALFYHNLSILILTVFLLSGEKKSEEAAFMNAKNLYYRRARLLKKGYYGVREIVVLERMTLGDAFKIMDFDQYHILIILDEDMKILHRYTESELLSAINEKGYNYTFRELLEG